MSGPENGSYVTQREFARLESTVNEIHGDVKTLIASHYRDEGVTEALQQTASMSRDKGARRLAIAGIVGALMSALWWVPEAVARAFHH